MFKLLEHVAAERRLSRITLVKLQIGRLQQIVPEMFTFAFDTISQGTLAEGAALEIVSVPIRMACQACGHEFIVETHVYICPECGHTRLTMLSGMEILLESLEGDLAE